ncbi:hypothetical protein CK203_115957 [Vitis vinifera]|uniref:Uncharacterized protein n=1 Tax=Vitis vinifera TaxID=29760 RepID=A0A438EIZ3_VITVI|nr:hypothetical protein CK203_115957 [Vitis vinifera]
MKDRTENYVSSLISWYQSSNLSVKTAMTGGRCGDESSSATSGSIQQMVMKLVIKGRGKLRHMIGTTKKPHEDDLTLQNWDLEDSIVIAWLINSIELKIGQMVLEKEPVTSLDEVFAQVKREENRRKVMLGEEKDSINTLMEGSALASKEVIMDTMGSRELEEECVMIIVIDLATPKTNVGRCMANLPIGGLDRMMEGVFRFQKMQEQSLKVKNPQPHKSFLARKR